MFLKAENCAGLLCIILFKNGGIVLFTQALYFYNFSA
ncbi:hypothetical protein N288_05055 [Bacillus infantis NRRL B-14911]|uniref:Uncharacterized protein n=1 Tax=Bacillus infantis NRRL B-14911 TaxID=1367477 RepID=U5L888_9BACI|nr:hypothetical protein N288_05055 [Bacillus infantis NRRL B-14911]